MKEFSDKELEVFYKEEKLRDIPDLWKNIEGNLAPKNTTTNIVETDSKGARKKHLSFRWFAGAAAVLVVAVLAIPGLRMLGGGSKSDGNNSYENLAKEAADEWQEGMADFDASAGEDGEGMPDASGDGMADVSGDGMSGASEGGIADVSGEGTADAPKNTQGSQAAGKEENEFHLEVEFTVEQVQTTMGGFLVTGEVLSSEENWFETGERVTLFYEGAAYQAEDFTGTLHVMLDVEEENLIILEILP